MIEIVVVGSEKSILAEELRGNKNVRIIYDNQKNIGTVGHVLTGKNKFAESINNGIRKGNKSDRKRDRKNRWR